MIPKKLNDKLNEDPWMARCCYKKCGKMPQWHHCFHYKDRSIQSEFNIVPACPKHHDQATPHKNGYKQEVREYFEWIAIQRMTDKDLFDYPKKDWFAHARYLSFKQDEYGWK